MKRLFSTTFLVLASPVLAEETRQLDAHEHGVGELNIAIDGKTVAMEFRAPGADIVGFEYVAQSESDIALVDEAVATLSQPMDLFVVSQAASCVVQSASAELEAESHEDHDDHDDHADHKDHDDHAEHKDHDDHKHHEDHEGHSKEASHTEFHAEYVFECENPGALDQMSFPYFDAFENARELHIQIVSSSGAGVFEVERGTVSLELEGLN